MTTTITHEDILREHAEVTESIGRIECALHEAARGEGTEWIKQMGELLWNFRRHLLRHFALEESGGFFLEVLNRAPHVSCRVEKLRRQHVEILKAMDELIGSSDLCTLGITPFCERFPERVSQLLSSIRKHEEEENELIQSVFCLDLGIGD